MSLSILRFQKMVASIAYMRITVIRRLLVIALPLAFIVVGVGAFVRLSDAGLGCPDWPGCYGQLIGVAVAEAAEKYDSSVPYDRQKAWIEVGHRYIAGLLGLLILVAAVLDWWQRRRLGLPQLLLLLVAVQGLLGMLTVTEKLRPVVVNAHLLGGLLILALLATINTRRPLSVNLVAIGRARLQKLWYLAIIVLTVQIILGGWVSTNYAGLSCPNFPYCQNGWAPPVMDFSGYHLGRALHTGINGRPISAAALSTIHWMHRLGALFVIIVFFPLVIGLWKYEARREGGGLSLFLIIQIVIGILNVVWQLPLVLAVAHNVVAAMLVINMAVLRVKLG